MLNKSIYLSIFILSDSNFFQSQKHCLKVVKSACGIEAVYMRFNGTGIWDGETLTHLAPVESRKTTTAHIYSNFSFCVVRPHSLMPRYYKKNFRFVQLTTFKSLHTRRLLSQLLSFPSLLKDIIIILISTNKHANTKKDY